jgi:hypothetical protein
MKKALKRLIIKAFVDLSKFKKLELIAIWIKLCPLWSKLFFV